MGGNAEPQKPVHGLLVEGTVRPRLSPTEQALFRSQGWSPGGCPLNVFPYLPSFQDGFLPLPSAPPSSAFGFPSPPPRTSAGVAVNLTPVATTEQLARRHGVLGRRGYALESAAARVCREACARVSTNVLVRDLDLLPLQHVDARRLEVVADGLPLFHGAQIAVDTTLVSPLRRDGTPHSRCAREDGAALRQARQRKERVYPELSGAHGRARLVVLASEVGGRWSAEAQAFLRQFTRAKSRQEPPTLRASAKLAWIWKWSMILACASDRAFALSFVESRIAHGCDVPTPTTAEVIGDSRYAGFA